MLIAVGSTNPTKIDPVRTVFSYHFSDIQVEGVSVSSGVAEQPMSDDEMYRGALMRARSALAAIPEAVYGVGIEGGLQEQSYGWIERSLVVIVDQAGHIGIGATAGIVLPDIIITKIKAGKNLEEVIDELFATKQIGEGIGMFGVMTNGLVTRTRGVEHGVAFALACFLHPKLYDK